MTGSSQDKGKCAPVLEEVRGEVTGVICNLFEKKGIPCRWGKVSSPSHFFLDFIDFLLQKTAHVWACLGCQQAQAKCHVGSLRRRIWRRGPAGGCG